MVNQSSTPNSSKQTIPAPKYLEDGRLEQRERSYGAAPLEHIYMPLAQRDEQASSKRIEKKFNSIMLEPVTLNIRSPRISDDPAVDESNYQELTPWTVTDPKYSLADGRQRVSALARKGVTSIPAGILQISFDDEVYFILHRDDDETKQTRNHRYGIRVNGGDPEYLLLNSIVEDQGYYVARQGFTPPKEATKIKTVTGIEDVFAMDRTGSVLNRSLDIANKCFFGSPLITDQDLVRGVGYVVKDYGNQITPEVILKWKQFSAATLKEIARPETSQSGRASAVAITLRKSAKIRKKAHASWDKPARLRK